MSRGLALTLLVAVVAAELALRALEVVEQLLGRRPAATS
jgi:hypothetical protein